MKRERQAIAVRTGIALAAIVAAAIAGCASVPPPPIQREVKAPPTAPPAPPAPVPQRRGGYYLDDGPGDHPPANLAQIPDAEPKVEPLSRYGNNPYVVFGREYVPDRSYRPFRQRGTASWYGRRFHGQRTSSGEAYDMYAMTAAHPTLPIPSYAKVTNVANGRSVVVRINDRGPFLHGRVIDLSYVAAWKLGYIEQGSALVELEALPVTRPQTVTAPTEAKPAQQARQPTNLSSATETAGIYVQLAAFAARETAESARARLALELAALDRAIEIYPKDGLFRLHVGPYRSRSEADAIADQLGKALESKPQIVIR